MDFLGVGSLGVLRFTETLTFTITIPRNDNPCETSHLFLATSRDRKEKKFHGHFSMWNIISNFELLLVQRPLWVRLYLQI